MSAISTLLTRAEICYERGQFKMVNSMLDEIGERIQENEVSDAEYEKYEWLCEHTQSTDSPEVERVNEQCEKCHGSKIFRYASGDVGACYDCQGKGFQTEQDIVRVKNYWAYRKGELAQRKAMAATQAVQTPFPF